MAAALARARVDRAISGALRRRAIWGIVLGASSPREVLAALRRGADPIEALASSRRPTSILPHYLVGYGGDIVRIRDQRQTADHVRLEARHRRAFLDGSWRQALPPPLVARWQRRWPGTASPLHLLPGVRPDHVYIEVELLPIVDGLGIQPMAPALRHTRQQHEAVVELGRDLAARLGFPTSWHRSGRLVAAEDLDPLRAFASGEWTSANDLGVDLGWLRRRIDLLDTNQEAFAWA